MSHKFGSGLQRAGTGIVLRGVRELEQTLDKVRKDVRERVVKKAAEESANVIMVEAKRLCPVKTGDLKRSIHVKKQHISKALSKLKKVYKAKIADIERTSYAVIAGEGFYQGKTWYGGIVEFGSEKWEGRPFMRPAAHAKRDVVRQIFRKAIRDVTKNSARRRANAAVTAITTAVD